MSPELAIFLTILIIAALLAIFVIFFIWNKKTPAPKGCENLEPNAEICGSCKKAGCLMRVTKTEATDEKENKQ